MLPGTQRGASLRYKGTTDLGEGHGLAHKFLKVWMKTIDSFSAPSLKLGLSLIKMKIIWLGNTGDGYSLRSIAHFTVVCLGLVSK